jgi:hypothetical protein
MAQASVPIVERRSVNNGGSDADREQLRPTARRGFTLGVRCSRNPHSPLFPVFFNHPSVLKEDGVNQVFIVNTCGSARCDTCTRDGSSAGRRRRRCAVDSRIAVSEHRAEGRVSCQTVL